MLTRLSFNEQGRITRHRDIWDVRDVLGLIPGMRVAQWVGTRVAAQGLSVVARMASWVFGIRRKGEDVERGDRDFNSGHFFVPTRTRTTSGASSRGEAGSSNALGLHLDDEREREQLLREREQLQRERERAVRVRRSSGSLHMKRLSEGSNARGAGLPYATPATIGAGAWAQLAGTRHVIVGSGRSMDGSLRPRERGATYGSGRLSSGFHSR